MVRSETRTMMRNELTNTHSIVSVSVKATQKMLLRTSSRRLISSATTTTRVIQPSASASAPKTAEVITDVNIPADTLANVSTDINNTVLNMTTETSLYTQLQMHELCYKYTPPGLMQNLLYGLHALHVPWPFVILSAGFSAPLIQELLFKTRRKFMTDKQRYFQYSRLILDRKRLLMAPNEVKVAREREKVDREFASLKLNSAPQFFALFKQSFVPLVGSMAVERMFNPSTAAIFADASIDALALCQNDPSYLIAAPIAYYNFLIFQARLFNITA